jgi:hypothetical protein
MKQTGCHKLSCLDGEDLDVIGKLQESFHCRGYDRTSVTRRNRQPPYLNRKERKERKGEQIITNIVDFQVNFPGARAAALSCRPL